MQAIAGSVLHGYRYLNPELGDGLDLGDIVDGLQHAIACSRMAGNLFAEAICMSLAIMPLTDRGDRRDAAALRATLGRIHEVRYDLALVMLAARLAVWLVRSAGTKPPTSSTDGSTPTFHPIPAINHPRSSTSCSTPDGPEARARGATMTHAELTEYLDANWPRIIDESTTSRHSRPARMGYRWPPWQPPGLAVDPVADRTGHSLDQHGRPLRAVPRRPRRDAGVVGAVGPGSTTSVGQFGGSVDVVGSAERSWWPAWMRYRR